MGGEKLMLDKGDKAPEFKLLDQKGKLHKLTDYKGKKIVLYFYPRDMTSGCTKEACNFRDDFSEYKKNNIVILGISCDDVKSHKKFVEKHDLPFTLLADTNKEVVKAYGALGKKKFLGREYEGINRITYLIDEKGIIVEVFPKVKIEQHSKEILDFFN